MILTHSVRVCLAVEPCDMRKGFNGLAALVAGQLKEEPASGKLFVFTNRARKQLSFSIPIRHGDCRVSVASVARTATARGPTKGTERHRDYRRADQAGGFSGVARVDD